MLDDSTSLSTYFEGCVIFTMIMNRAQTRAIHVWGWGGAVGTEEVHEYTKTTSKTTQTNQMDLLKQGVTKNQALESGDFTRTQLHKCFAFTGNNHFKFVYVM
jgi:hypothetical protein